MQARDSTEKKNSLITSGYGHCASNKASTAWSSHWTSGNIYMFDPLGQLALKVKNWDMTLQSKAAHVIFLGYVNTAQCCLPEMPSLLVSALTSFSFGKKLLSEQLFLISTKRRLLSHPGLSILCLLYFEQARVWHGLVCGVFCLGVCCRLWDSEWLVGLSRIVYGCLEWFSIRGRCLSLSLIGNHI